MIKNMDDIVVTGQAAVSAAGVGLEPLREALRRGSSHLQPVPEEILGEGGHFWGKADAFRAGDFMPPLKARKFDRCSLFAVVAAGMALKHAGVDMAATDRTRIGIVLGCGFGGIVNSEEFLSGYFTAGIDGLAPMLFPNTVPNAPASNASIEHGLKGPNVTFVQRFCSAEAALMMALRFLEEERADIMLTGGVDDLSPGMLKGFKSLGQLRSHGEGFGEGAGLLVLEKRDHAFKRGADIMAGVGNVRSIGLLVPGAETEGIDRLWKSGGEVALVSLSGSACEMRPVLDRLPPVPRLETGKLLGRSLAMGGLAMVSHILTLPAGRNGLHLAASPEGPYFAIDFHGGPPVQT
ncbi:MAG: beta-ketoacyl [Geobacteraceae bacterium]|nr:MAG: beta-ketoacyl [Geobacteraceae bacterium]